MQEKFDKVEYARLKEYASNSNIRFFCVDVTGQGYPYNGISIAYGTRDNIPDCRMVEVSVSYCAPEDTFKAKRGKFQALNKMIYIGEHIDLPLGTFYREAGGKALREVLSSMFLV
jgi:hypothetical protein